METPISPDVTLDQDDPLVSISIVTQPLFIPLKLYLGSEGEDDK